MSHITFGQRGDRTDCYLDPFTKRCELADLDGMRVSDHLRLPHPTQLARWSDGGYYTIDADAGVFRLTEAGRRAAW